MKYYIFQYTISILLIITMSDESAANTDLPLANMINHNHLKLIESSMDLTVNPCNDFYQYACGNWEKVHAKTLEHYEQNYDVVEHLYNKEIGNIFLNSFDLKGQPKFVRNAYAYFKSCLNMQHYDLLEYLTYFLNKEQLPMSSWPFRPADGQRDLNWIRNLAIMHKYGLTRIFVEENIKPIIGFEEIEIAKPLTDGGFQKLTYNDLHTINSVSFKLNTNVLNALWESLSIFELKLKDLQNLPTDPERMDTFTINRLDALPVWLRQFVILLLQQMNLLRPQVQIVIKDMPYMYELVRLLQEYDELFLCKYLEIRFLFHLYQGDFQVPFEFTPERCIDKGRNFMNLAFAWLYVTHKPEVLKEIPQIEEMFHQITKQYKKILLANTNGFHPEIIKYLVIKLDNIKLRVGVLPRQKNTVNKLENIYKILDLNENNLFDNQFQLLEFYSNYRRISQKLPNNPYEFYDLTREYSPYYRGDLNLVTIPLSVLHLPIYHAKLNDAYKYSSMGYIMGHEISHAFDLQRFQNDLIFNFSLDPDVFINSNPKYNSNLNCLLNLNDLAINEKISDITGFRVAYETFMNLYPNSRYESLIINNMEFTVNGIFFLNFANFKCSSFRANHIDIDHTHGTPHDRLIDTFAHFPEFVKTYNCAKYDRMNLEKTCQLWRK